MSKTGWIARFDKLNSERVFATAKESLDWIEQYGHKDGDKEFWDVLPGKNLGPNELLLSDTGIYAGAAGVALLYLRAYAASLVAQRPENAGKNIVAILADNGMKYLSTNMYPLDTKVQ